jgi:hypothetical protein
MMNVDAGMEYVSFIICTCLFQYLELSHMCECSLCEINLEIVVCKGAEVMKSIPHGHTS